MQVMVERSLTLVSWQVSGVRAIVGAGGGARHQNNLCGAGANLHGGTAGAQNFKEKPAPALAN
jgi:hypothetical protein